MFDIEYGPQILRRWKPVVDLTKTHMNKGFCVFFVMLFSLKKRGQPESLSERNADLSK
jgi:hypothetical protein